MEHTVQHLPISGVEDRHPLRRVLMRNDVYKSVLCVSWDITPPPALPVNLDFHVLKDSYS